MSVIFDKPTHSFQCTGCGAVVEIPQRVVYSSEAFAAKREYLNVIHPSGCRLIVRAIEAAPEIDWRIEIRPLGVAQ